MLNRHALFVRCGRQLLWLLWYLCLCRLLVTTDLCTWVGYLGFGCFLLLCFHLCIRPRRLSAGFRRHDRRERLVVLLIIQGRVVDVHLCPAWVGHGRWYVLRIQLSLDSFGIRYNTSTEVQWCALLFFGALLTSAFVFVFHIATHVVQRGCRSWLDRGGQRSEEGR